MTVRGETDWLGTQPCFYHERSGAVSACIHDVIDYRNLEFDPDGLRDYLDFGYGAFGYTPVRHVRFLPPGAQLISAPDGRLRVEARPDPVEAWRGGTTTPEEAIARLQEAVARWTQSFAGPLLLPLSGGLDSRLLAHLVPDKSRVRAFTYGVAARPETSSEVTRARVVAQRLGLAWEQIPLGDFHGRIEAWDEQFGVSTHAHGMYHLEFYERIAARIGRGLPLLSGLVGDAWAGSIAPLPATEAAHLVGLGLTRGQRAEAAPLRLRAEGRHRAEFWAERGRRFQDPVFQIVEVIRQKMLLLSFALSVPRRCGFAPWSPFLVPDVALAMVTLPPELRRGRRWQREYFARHDLAVEREAGGSRENNLDLHAVHRAPPPPLDAGVLRELFPEDYVSRVNRLALAPGVGWRRWALAQGYPAGQRLAALAHLPNPHQRAYAAYLTLRPLESLLRRRNAA